MSIRKESIEFCFPRSLLLVTNKEHSIFQFSFPPFQLLEWQKIKAAG